MLVSELKKLLEQCSDDDIVVLSRDSEGNSFSPLAGCSQEVYVPESSWYGEIYIRELTPELKQRGFCEDDLYTGENGRNALVLWPTN